MITINYNLLKPYKEGPFEINIINNTNAIRVQDIVFHSQKICQAPGQLQFWARLTDYPEDLGLFVDWVLVYIIGLPGKTSIVIDFQEYSNVLGEWEFKDIKAYVFPEQISSENINDISPLLNELENLIKKIKSSPFEYNNWVLDNIPIVYRTGSLSIDDYFRICPEGDPALDEEEIKEYNTSSPHYVYDNLTLRKYIEIFVSIHSKMTGMSRKRYGGDIQYYQNVTGEINLLQTYPNLDSSQELFNFCIHSFGQSKRFDLVPAKVQLVPVVVGVTSHYYVHSGLWQIFLNIYDRDYIKFALKGWFARKREVYLRDEDKIIKFLQHKGKVSLKPNPTVGIRREGENVSIEVFYPLEEPSRMDEIKKLITLDDTLELKGIVRF